MEHNNYTNMFLKTLGDQLNRVKEIIETQDHIKTLFVKKDNKPLFKPFEFSKKFQENPHIDQALIDRISQKVKDSLIVPETPQPSHRRINVIKEEISSKAKVDELIKIFEEPPNQTVLRIIHNHLRLGIIAIDQHFLICSMRKEPSIINLPTLVVLSMNGI